MFDIGGKKISADDPLNESRLDQIDLQTLAKLNENDEELLKTEEDLKRSVERRNIQVMRKSSIVSAPTSKKNQIQQELDHRSLILWDDTSGEFRKAQAELRMARVTTKAATLQILNKNLMEKISLRRSKSHGESATQESLNQRVTESLIKRKTTVLYQ